MHSSQGRGENHRRPAV